MNASLTIDYRNIFVGVWKKKYFHITLNSALQQNFDQGCQVCCGKCCTNTPKTHCGGSSITEGKLSVSHFWKEDERNNKHSTCTGF